MITARAHVADPFETASASSLVFFELERFDRVGRDPNSKEPAIGLCVAGLGADRNCTPVGDLRYQHLLDEASVIQFGGREGPTSSPPQASRPHLQP
jgi:hypothetical protein